mmetsp:Transcript_37254/g.41676  ORF Transcript_37254/g.41676 Transcript_37254/m.41676 type:complete len:117 (-) Transcript_37254:91-441(-)
MKTGNCWLGICLEFIANVLISCGCLGFVLRKYFDPEEDKDLANTSGMALLYLFNMTGYLVYAVRMASDFEANMVSVERIRQYINLEREAPHQTPTDRLLEKDWPAKGLIEFKNSNM